jgi:hypothetical protein
MPGTVVAPRRAVNSKAGRARNAQRPPAPGLGGSFQNSGAAMGWVIDEVGALRLNIEIVLSRLFGLPARL